MKRIILLFAGAAVSFLLLSYIDEYENVILPFFRDDGPKIAARPERVADEIKRTIEGFTDSLEKAYLSSDPSLLRLVHIDDRLYSSISQEIDYLQREGRVMDLDVKDVMIENIESISKDILRVTTSEKVGVKYINARDKKETVYPDATYIMVYTLAVSDRGLKVINYETIGARPWKE